MVKLQDGSLVPAAALLSGDGEDDEGNKLTFKPVEGATMPTFYAMSEMKDGSGRLRTYTFGFEDTNVIVHMAHLEKAAAPAKQELVAAAKNASAPQSGKAAGYTVQKAGYSVSPNPSKK